VKRARVLLAAGLILASCLAAPPAISWLRGAESLPGADAARIAALRAAPLPGR